MKRVIGTLAFFSLLYFSRGFAEDRDEKLANQVRHKTIKRLPGEKNLLCIGTEGALWD